MKVSLAARALLALVLMVGFYVLGLAMAGGLLWLVYAQVALIHRISIKLSLLCVIAAGTILWAMVPRWDSFEPPGPELTEADHPELFAVIRQVAEATGQAMPSEVYLVNDMNAFVAQRGGIMGLFSRRVMGLGLPLLQVLTISQVRAVIAHEFGHFHGGDTRLGPWIYKTRAAIARTIMGLGDTVLNKPFAWYFSMFLRITQAISRRQELAADALAARTEGPNHLADGLRATHGGALAFNAYWQTEYAPAVAAGFKPPLADGFSRFLGNDRLTEALDKALTAELESDEEDPYDTHPPLPRRLEALASLGLADTKGDDRKAVDLLGGDCEDALLDAVVLPEFLAKARAIDWEDAPRKIYLPQWRELTDEIAEVIAKISPRKIPTSPGKLAEWAGRMANEDISQVPTDAAAHYAAERFAAAMGCALLRRGWEVQADPGQPFVFTKDEQRLEPFKDLHDLVNGELDAETWTERLEAAGVERMRLIKRQNADDDG